MTADTRKNDDPTLVLLRKFRFLLPIAFVGFIVVPRAPHLVSDEPLRQVGAALGIGWYLCLSLALWHMSKLPEPGFCRLLTVGSAAWFVAFLAWDTWSWTSRGFDARYLPFLGILLGMTVVSALSYRRASRAGANASDESV